MIHLNDLNLFFFKNDRKKESFRLFFLISIWQFDIIIKQTQKTKGFLMTNVLQLTIQEFNEIEKNNRFKVKFNDLPFNHKDFEEEDDFNENDYMEDDGREYRLMIFVDKKTNCEYEFSYVYHPEFSEPLYSSAFELPKNVEIVNESVICHDEADFDHPSVLSKLKEPMTLTHEDLELIAADEMDLLNNRFQTVYNEIPLPKTPKELKNWNRSDYINDKIGRELRTCVFKDVVTDKEYSFNYFYFKDMESSFPNHLIENSIKDFIIADQSSLNLFVKKTKQDDKTETAKEKVDTILLDEDSAQAKANKLNEELNLGEEPTPLDLKMHKLDSKKIKEICDYLNDTKNKFSIYDIQVMLLPICIEHNITLNSLWHYIQKKRGSWM